MFMFIITPLAVRWAREVPHAGPDGEDTNDRSGSRALLNRYSQRSAHRLTPHETNQPQAAARFGCPLKTMQHRWRLVRSNYFGAVACPLCLAEFRLADIADLSREHVVPSKLGGRTETLTCRRKCNNTHGSRTDSLERLRVLLRHHRWAGEWRA